MNSRFHARSSATGESASWRVFRAAACRLNAARQPFETSSSCLTASNYAGDLVEHKRFEEAKAMLLKRIPVARRVLGESHENTLKMSVFCATALYKDPSATFDDLRTAVTMLEDASRIARRVLGGEHPLTKGIGDHLRDSRRVLARASPA